MAGILTTELEENVIPNKASLTVEECLGEFNDGLKEIARKNLNVYSRDEVYDITNSDRVLNETIKKAFDKYLNLEDPHGILPVVRLMIEGFVKNDGTTPFTTPQPGVDPIQDFHLATKRFVTTILRDHLSEKDPHRILPEVEDMLEQYVKQSEIYFRNQLYTKDEIDTLFGSYIKKDGTTPFTKAQIGADPQIDSHLATKRYVDKVIYNHLVDVDPHGFIAILNQRLASYAKANNVYDKSQTYSRAQVDFIIRGLVGEAAKEVINDHLNSFDPHNILAEVRKERYVKQDGTIPFRAPLKGVDAVDPQDLVTLHQIEEKVQGINTKIEEKEPIWITSGPTEAAVGMVNEGDVLANEVSFLEAMDAIFYGKRVKLTVLELANIGESSPITLCIQGSLATVEYAEIWQDGNYIDTITKEQLEESHCITIDSLPIESDSQITAKVFYTNGSIHEVTETIRLALPVFVGILPKWKFGNTVTYSLLKELYLADPENSRFYNKGIHLQLLEHSYNFNEDEEQKLLVAIPANYNNLVEMSNSALVVTLTAFEIIDLIPFLIPGSENDVIYKLYFYKQDLFSLNTTVNFKFK